MERKRFTIFDNKPYGLRAGAIIVKDDQILLIRRLRQGKEYYVFPGGGVDPGETVQQGIIREVEEETAQTVTVDYVPYHLDLVDDSDQYFGFCHHIAGEEPHLNGEERDRHCEENQYHPLWMPLATIANLRLLPIVVRDWLVTDLPAMQNGERPTRHQTQQIAGGWRQNPDFSG